MSISNTAQAAILNSYNNEKELVGVKSSRYYILDNQKIFTISNVPSELYENVDCVRYQPPLPRDNEANILIELLKQNINRFHNHPEAKGFQLNQCFNNSKIFFDSLYDIDEKKYNIKAPVNIALGYITRKVILENKSDGEKYSFITHDWHIWNYINNFLVDITLLNMPPTVHPDTVLSWGKADDHVFFLTPEDTEYYGIQFDDYKKFENYCRDILKS